MTHRTQKKIILLTFVFLQIFFHCSKEADNKTDQKELPAFGNKIDLGLVEDERITEASGLVASFKNLGVLWTHNDKGGQNIIFAINSHGKKLGAFHLFGVENRDWEDLAIGSGPVSGMSYLYIGEIGDNEKEYTFKYIYRVLEPDVDSSKFMPNRVLYDVETIKIKYPSDKLNAETLLHDPLTNDLYVITKEDNFASVYFLGFPQATSETITLELKTMIQFGMIVGGDISRNGNEIILKSLDKIYYWQRKANVELWESFKMEPTILPYDAEPQGEAICWDPEKLGYYTLSEEQNNVPAHLYYYPRLNINKSIRPFIFEF